MGVITIISEILVWIAYPFVLIYGFFNSRARKGIKERFGLLRVAPGDAPATVICCASVGEVVTASSFVWKWLLSHPYERVIIATSSPEGKKTALGGFDGKVEAYLRPIDLGRRPAAWLEILNVKRLILLETELWPFFLWETHERNIPVHVISGRISNRSFAGYMKLKWLFGSLLKKITSIAAQSETHAKRFIELGANPDKVIVTGNLKFSSTRQEPEEPEGLAWIMDPFSEDSIVLVAGSTHAGEEKAILDAYESLTRKFDDIKLLIAPRHTDRAPEVEALIKQKGYPLLFRSKADPARAARAPIMILDTLGELSATYKWATVAFVGGSLVDVGGHNVLEPARFGIPVLYGPYVDNFIDETTILDRSGGGALVADAHSLAVVLHELLESESLLKEKGAAAKKALEKIHGILDRTIESISIE